MVSFVKREKYQYPFVMVPLHESALLFFQAEYGTGKHKVVFASKRGILGAVVDLFAERQPYRVYKLRKRMPAKKLTIKLPEKMAHCKISEESILLLSKLLSDIFKQQFVAFVDGAVNTGCSESFAVECFLKKYAIPVDYWDFHAAKMVYRRAKGYEK